jgi:hypothetical protein
MIANGRVIYFDTTLRLDGRHMRLVIGTDEARELEAAWRSCATALIRVGKSRMRAPAVRQP